MPERFMVMQIKLKCYCCEAVCSGKRTKEEIVRFICKFGVIFLVFVYEICNLLGGTRKPFDKHLWRRSQRNKL